MSIDNFYDKFLEGLELFYETEKLKEKADSAKKIIMDIEKNSSINDFINKILKEINSIIEYFNVNNKYFKSENGKVVLKHDLQQYNSRINLILKKVIEREDLKFINNGSWYNLLNDNEKKICDSIVNILSKKGKYPDHLPEEWKPYFSYMLEKGIIKEGIDFVFDHGETTEDYIKKYSIKNS